MKILFFIVLLLSVLGLCFFSGELNFHTVISNEPAIILYALFQNVLKRICVVRKMINDFNGILINRAHVLQAVMNSSDITDTHMRAFVAV